MYYPVCYVGLYPLYTKFRGGLLLFAIVCCFVVAAITVAGTVASTVAGTVAGNLACAGDVASTVVFCYVLFFQLFDDDRSAKSTSIATLCLMPFLCVPFSLVWTTLNW